MSTLPWFSLGAPMICLLFIRATRDLVDDIVSAVGHSCLGEGAGTWRGALGESESRRGLGFLEH